MPKYKIKLRQNYAMKNKNYYKKINFFKKKNTEILMKKIIINKIKNKQ